MPTARAGERRLFRSRHRDPITSLPAPPRPGPSRSAFSLMEARGVALCVGDRALLERHQMPIVERERAPPAHVVGRESPFSLYNQDLVTFEEGAVAYDQRDAAGFIKLNALRLRLTGARRGRQ